MACRPFARLGHGLPVLLAFLLFLPLGSAPLKAELSPEVFLEDLQGKVSSELAGEATDRAAREARFRDMFEVYFALPTIGRFVLGRYWRRASPVEREDFLQTFEDVIVQRFLPILAEETDIRFEFGKVTKDARDPDMLLVASRIPREEGEPYKVTWRLKKYDGSFKILDIITEGVSMAITLRSEYVSYIKANGGKVARLVASLREKVAQGAFAP